MELPIQQQLSETKDKLAEANRRLAEHMKRWSRVCTIFAAHGGREVLPVVNELQETLEELGPVT